MDCYQRGRGMYMHHLRLKVHSICRENIKEGKRKRRPGSVRFKPGPSEWSGQILLPTDSLKLWDSDRYIHRHLLMIYTREQKKRGRPRSIHHMKDVRWTQRGHREKGLIFKYVDYVLNLKASFLLVKTSSFDHTKVWSPKLWYPVEHSNG